jgi:hypothetical protein
LCRNLRPRGSEQSVRAPQASHGLKANTIASALKPCMLTDWGWQLCCRGSEDGPGRELQGTCSGRRLGPGAERHAAAHGSICSESSGLWGKTIYDSFANARQVQTHYRTVPKMAGTRSTVSDNGAPGALLANYRSYHAAMQARLDSWTKPIKLTHIVLLFVRSILDFRPACPAFNHSNH